MSTVGEAIARATAAGQRAAFLAPLVHCDVARRDTFRWKFAMTGTSKSWEAWRELEERWMRLDTGKPAWGKGAWS